MLGVRHQNMNLDDLAKLALKFAGDLKNERFESAHAQLTQANRLMWSSSSLQKQYEEMISYGDGPTLHLNVEVTDDMKDWLSEKRKEDLGWVYVSMRGEDFSEAVALIFTEENGEPKIREIEWGRP